MRRAVLVGLGLISAACGAVLGVEPLQVDPSNAIGPDVHAGDGSDGTDGSDASTAPVDAAQVAIDASAFAEAGAQCSKQGPLTARSVTTDGTQRNPWSQLDNLSVADGKAVQNAGCCSGDTSQGLLALNFGFSVPADAGIQGVVVHTRVRAETANEAFDGDVKLLSGANQSDDIKVTTFYPTTYVDRTYGSETDTSDLALTPSLVNDATFGVGLTTSKTAGEPPVVVDLDELDVTVFFCVQ